MREPVWLDRQLVLALYEDVVVASGAVAISGNHPFIYGNKRVAFVALGQFLEDNGLMLIATDADATRTMMSLAAGEIDLPELTLWLRAVVKAA